jgi:hypothetical protein
MNSPNTALRLAAIFSGVICLGHLWRLLAHIDVRIGSHDIPSWPSLLAVIVAGALSLWFWRLSSHR